jgi:hypothetical protein
MDAKEAKEKASEAIKAGKDKLGEAFSQENIEAGKEKLKAGTAEVKKRISLLPFRAMAEKKIPAETKTKFPILNTLIPLTNFIICGLVAVLLIVVISSIGSGGSSSILANSSWYIEEGFPGFPVSFVTVLDFGKKNITMTSFQYSILGEGDKEIVKGTYKIFGDNNVSITLPDKKLEGSFTKDSLIVDGKRYKHD